MHTHDPELRFVPTRTHQSTPCDSFRATLPALATILSNQNEHHSNESEHTLRNRRVPALAPRPSIPASNEDDTVLKWAQDRISGMNVETHPNTTNMSSFPIARNDANIRKRNKRSRYLREIDRRTILLRIENGEKQADLAKEYQVSRAAICNLNKNRTQVLSRRNKNPFAKHPKHTQMERMTNPNLPESPCSTVSEFSVTTDELKCEFTRTIRVELDTPTWTQAATRNGSGQFYRVDSVAMKLIITFLLTKFSSMSTTMFERTVERVIRLLLEEALAKVPNQEAAILLDNGEMEKGLVMSFPFCGVSLEQNGSPMLNTLQYLDPSVATGRIRPVQGPCDGNTESLKLMQSNLPSNLQNHCVLVLDLITFSGHSACKTIDWLKWNTISTIILVTFMISPIAIEKLQKCANVTVVTAIVYDFQATNISEQSCEYPSVLTALFLTQLEKILEYKSLDRNDRSAQK
uniref:Uncharacterized protein AlNc14C96G5878 n=1 Tax=Albugo laibachii Nc14 TaxID=890382 RepID=F0WH03_9STRA|nr:conserved hypothetical protein [Albugo laibachii Nc14]|eukprot:CCA20518.1 conserved hypothetical protein [Albugo laibachii Nc14]